MRLESLVPPDAVRMEELGKRMKMSNAERARLEAWARADAVKPGLSEQALKKAIYRGSKPGFAGSYSSGLMRRARQEAVGSDEAMIRAGGVARLLDAAEHYDAPVFPITGGDLLARGIEKGPGLGETLRSLETLWIDSCFSLDREALLRKLDRDNLND